MRALQADGWYLEKTVGSHHQFKHPTRGGKVTVQHPRKDIPPGTLGNIERQSGLTLRRQA